MKHSPHEQLRLIRHLSVAMIQATALEDLYEEAMNGICSTLNVDRASILLFDEDGVMRFKATRRLSERYKQAVEGHSPWPKSASNPPPLLVSDVAQDSSLEAYQEIFASEGIRSLAFIPLVSPAGLLGKFMLYYDSPHAFTDDEVQFAQAIASHVALMIERKRTELALRSSLSTVRALIASTQSGVLFENPDRTVAFSNPSFDALFGIPPSQSVAGADCRKLAKEYGHLFERPEQFVGCIEETIAREEPVQGERLPMRDGRILERDYVAVRTEEALCGHLWIYRDITDRVRAEEALRVSEQFVRELHELSAGIHILFDDKVQQLLGLGCRRFGLPIGILSHVDGDRYEVVGVQAPGDGIVKGAVYALGETYCQETLRAQGPIGFAHASESEWRTHPCYLSFRLEAYLGCPVFVRGEVYGTLNFSSPQPYGGRFTDGDKDFLQLMARWIGSELERCQAEEVIRQSEERFRALYDDNPTMYFTVAPDGTILSVNRFGADELAYRPDELIGNSVSTVFHEEDKHAASEALRSAFAQPERLACWEFRKVKKTGEVIWVREAVRILPAAGNVPVALIVCHDVSAEKGLLQKLVASEALFRTFMDHLPGPAFIKNMEGQHLFMNPACERLLHLARDEWRGKSNASLFSRSIATQLSKHDQEVLTHGRARYFNEQTDQGGECRHWLVIKFPIVDEGGRASLLGGVAFDVTDQKRVESALHAVQAKLHQAVQAGNIGLWEWNTDTGEVFYSAEWKRQLGHEEDEITGQFEEWACRLHPDDHERAIAYARRYVADPQGEYSQEYRMRHKDGSYRWIAARASFVTEADGRRVRLLGSHGDVTMMKETEERLRALHAQYESLIHSIDGIVWEANPSTFQFTFVSAYAERVLGYPVTQWLSEPAFWLNHLHPEDREWAYAFCRRASTLKQDHRLEYRMQAADGRTVWLRDVVTVITDEKDVTRMFGIMVDVTDRKEQEERVMRLANELDLIQWIQAPFLAFFDHKQTFARALEALLAVTKSEYGFIGEKRKTPDGKPYLRTHAITDIAWNAETRALMETQAPYLEFFNMRSLFGAVLTSGEPVIANDPASDPRRCGLPPGHPPLHSFLGVPIHKGDTVIGMIGVANRPGGYTDELVPQLQPILSTCATLLEALRVEQHRQQAEQELQSAHARLRELTFSLTQVEEETRRRLSRDLHDELGQSLTALKLELGWIKSEWERNPANPAVVPLLTRIDTMSRMLNSLINTTRRLAGLLRPNLLDDFGLAVALESLVKSSAERMGIPYNVSIDSGISSLMLPDMVTTTLFRMAQELLTNVARHSQATEVRLTLRLGHGSLSDLGDSTAANDAQASASFSVGRTASAGGSAHETSLYNGSPDSSEHAAGFSGPGTGALPSGACPRSEEDKHHVQMRGGVSVPAPERNVGQAPRWLALEIVDNGVGMSESAHGDQRHLGLKGVRERAELLGGSVEIVSSAGRGTRVIVRLPVEIS